MQPLILVTGGIQSGKSQIAERYAQFHCRSPLMIAPTRHAEMTTRINRSVRDSAERWSTIDQPLDLPTTLRNSHQKTKVVDCLSVWLSNVLGEHPEQLTAAIADLMTALAEQSAPTVLVTSESSLDAIGDNPLNQQHTEAIGLLNQTIGKQATAVIYCVAGLPQWLKGDPLF